MNKITIQFATSEDLEWFTKCAKKASESAGTIAPLYCGLLCSSLRKAKVTIPTPRKSKA